MESSVIQNEQIDWKKIGTSKQHQENTTVAVATPQKPTMPKTRIAYPNNNTKPSTPAVAKIRPVKQYHQNVPNVQNVEPPVRKTNSDKGGMEMLDNEFILNVIEQLQGNEKNDLVMRKIGFYEILRRGLESMIDSNALKIYAIDEHAHYGKHIQCNAMQELDRRTA